MSRNLRRTLLLATIVLAMFAVVAAPAMAQVCNSTNVVTAQGSLSGKVPGPPSPTSNALLRYTFGNSVTSDCDSDAGNGGVSQRVTQAIVRPSCNLIGGACVNDAGGDDANPATPAVAYLSLNATTCTGGLANIVVDSSDPYAIKFNFLVPLIFPPNTSCSVDVTLNVRERGNATTTNTIAQQFATDATCQCTPELNAAGAATSQIFLTCPPCSTNFCAPETCNANTVQCTPQAPPDCSNPDNDLCTPGSCDMAANGGNGACVNGPRTVCPNSDNDLCTTESCVAATGQCVTGARTVCPNSDNDLCTAESCVAATGQCVTGARTVCPNGDNDLCTSETCSAATGACVTGSRTVCGNENNFCAPGHCAATTGSCVLDPTPDCTNPDNDLCTPGFCDQTANGGIGACANGPRTVCPNSDNDLCTAESCVAATGACVTGARTVCPNGDNDLCTAETCSASTGACVTGSRTVCGNENNFCAPGHCAATTGSCVLDPTPDCTNPDNDLCTPGFCDQTANGGIGACANGPRTVCPNGDNDLCTAESCVAATGACVTGPRTVCPNGDNDLCTAESCNAASGLCVTGPRNVCGNENNFCAPGHCAATTGTCVLDPTPDCSNPDNDLCTSGFCDQAQNGGLGACANGPRTICADDTCQVCAASSGFCVDRSPLPTTCSPHIAIRKLTNGADANDPNGPGVPQIPPSGVVTWRYEVTNPGTIPVPRANISVTDSQPGVTPQPVLVGAFVSGDANTNNFLDPGETWVYEATGIAYDLTQPPPPGVIVQADACHEGNAQNPGSTAYINIGTVTIPGDSASDPSSYCNPPCTTCAPIGECTVTYPFSSENPLTSVAFNESEVLRSFTATVGTGCMPDQIRLYYNDEHALTLGVRRVVVKTSSGTTATDYVVSPLVTSPGSVINPQIGTTAGSGDQAGTDLSGRPLAPSLFITDTTADPTSMAGDWQFGGTAIPPHAVFGTWKAAVRTVDKTKSPAVVTITPDADPAQNHWNLGGGDPVPAGLVDQGFGAEARWDASLLNLIPGHTYRFYFMVHDGDQNKSGGDTGHGCANLQTAPECVPACETDADCEDSDVCTNDLCVNNQCVHEVPPGSSCQCTTSCPDIDHGGLITTTTDANGDVTVVFNQTTDLNDNSYGTNIVNWPNSHSFGNLTGSDKAQFVFKDANGHVVFDFYLDYLSSKSGTPSGYASLGATGGDGGVNSGQSSWLLDWQTSLAANLNNTGYCNAGNCTVSGVNLLVNSPPTTPAHTGYGLPPAFSQWDFNIVYTVKVSHLAFGAAGFGSVSVPIVHNSPAKCGTNAAAFGSCSCSGTIGDLVWNDLNQNGIQDAGEPGLAGVGLTLRDGSNQAIATTTSTTLGYEFTGLCPGAYSVEVNASTLPAGFVPSPCNVGSDETRDNDCSPAGTTLTNSVPSYRILDFGYHGRSCTTSAQCTDNNVCNGVETCAGSTCQPGVPLNCNDGVSCTTDSCDPITGCSNTSAGSHASMSADFNGTAIPAGKYIWFNANFKASGVGTQKTTVRWANSTITFKVGAQVYTLPVPNATIVFDPAATCATTSFVGGQWQTTVPLSGSDEIFLSGLSYLVPSNFPGGIKPVTWQGDFFIDKPGVSVEWKWGAAVYANTNMSDYNAIGVKPMHTNTCLYNNSDHAGTPENKKSFVVGGARGGGGSNFTGSWSGKETVHICPAPALAALGSLSGLRFTDRSTLNWVSDPNAPYYDVIRSDVADLRASTGVGGALCFDDDADTNLLSLDDVPAPGQCFYYIARGDGLAVNPGTYDSPGAARTGGEARDTELGTASGVDCTHRRP